MNEWSSTYSSVDARLHWGHGQSRTALFGASDKLSTHFFSQNKMPARAPLLFHNTAQLLVSTSPAFSHSLHDEHSCRPYLTYDGD